MVKEATQSKKTQENNAEFRVFLLHRQVIYEQNLCVRGRRSTCSSRVPFFSFVLCSLCSRRSDSIWADPPNLFFFFMFAHIWYVYFFFFSLFFSTSLTEKVTEIKTNIFVTSFGPVSDTEMVSSLFDLKRIRMDHSEAAVLRLHSAHDRARASERASERTPLENKADSKTRSPLTQSAWCSAVVWWRRRRRFHWRVNNLTEAVSISMKNNIPKKKKEN